VTEPDELLTVEEVAEMARVHPETVRRWIKNKRLPAARPTGTPQGPYRIHSTDVARLLGGLPKGDAANSPQLSATEEERRQETQETFDNLPLEVLVELQKVYKERLDAVARALVRKGPYTETPLTAKQREQREQQDALPGVDDVRGAEAG
jgi:excisionase family DNA binding protein